MPRTRRTESQMPAETAPEPEVVVCDGERQAVGDRELPDEDTLSAASARKAKGPAKRRLDATGTGW